MDWNSNEFDGSQSSPTYTSTDNWLPSSTPSGTASLPAIDWNAVLVSGVPRLIDNIFGNTVDLSNARPVLNRDGTYIRTPAYPGSPAATSPTLTLLIVAGLVWMLAKG